MQTQASRRKRNPRPLKLHRGLLIFALFLLELFALVIVHQFFVTFECGDTDAMGTCRFLRSLVARSLVVFAAFGVLYWARPRVFSDFAGASARYSGGGWIGVHFAGLALIWTPLLLTGSEGLGANFDTWALLWALGSALCGLGGMFWIAAPKDWLRVLAQDRFLPVLLLSIAIILPDVADLILPLWDLGYITNATFFVVYQLLSLFNSTTYADPAAYIIGVEQFAVHIARQCSGVEGVALTTAFVLFYALLFRRDLRLTRYWLTVLPLGILFSLLLNVVRIAVLILIGAHISPDLAVNGFHSYAGWLFFTILALVLIFAVQKVRWLHRDTVTRPPVAPVKDDPLAAQILPFVAFMLAGILTQALIPVPSLGYPLIVLVLGLATWTFRHHYRSLPWSLDPLSIGAGVVVGLGWVVLAQTGTAEASSLAQDLALLSPALLAFWIIMRLTGTILLVPLVEEMFFRGYILARLDRGGMLWRIIAVVFSSLLFAALHGRWVVAGIAGVIFALVMLRRGRVSDAVIAHMTANAIVAAAALLMRDFALI
ncbi:exosortase E/protease, VPEID-CTERM system [Seohaeicola saemankumensis]|uniref:exosortase E/protease, VPEID-CTERM system n=1 Tax=Seohaeicola saemankumensis TaxID=481181 RepID=UPI001E4482E6|nr:exosortase E/protease, VPEID-CTERM system [Seohaeicola saemankumensis]MCD1627374.1 exosortase E/protease, VPEID-CTERM system [Seohaeicola saemankumensis]